MLKVRNVSLSYDKVVLSKINLSVKKGETVGLVGASGGGKSSLLKIIAGLLDANKGEVFLDGNYIPGPSNRLIPGHPDIQLVNQDFGLDLYHTVRENVTQKMLHLSKKQREEFATELLELVEIEQYQNRQAHTLSGGEQQRLAIIRALALEPKVLLLDEPFAHLDVHLKNKIGNYLQQLCAIRKMICILVSHEGQDVLAWSKRIFFIEDGEITRVDSPQAFYYQPTSMYEGSFFGELNELQIDKKKVFFRPTEFEISDSGIELKAKKQHFQGAYWRNEFQKGRKKVILYATSAMPEDILLEIKKHSL